MLGSRWLRHYLFAFAAQSWLIAILSAAVGYYGDYPELYIIAILTATFRGLLLPYLILRIIRRMVVHREVLVILQVSSTLVIGAFAVIFALAVAYRIGAALNLGGTIAVLALTVMLSMKLIGFLMLSVRHEALSQILGLLVLENGVFLGAQNSRPGHAAPHRDRYPFRSSHRRRVLWRARALSARPCRNHQFPRAQATGGMMIATGILALLLALAPALAIVLILLIDSPRAAEALNLVASAVSLAAILAILALDDAAATFWGGYVLIDGLGTWTILCAAIVYCLASLYAVGYMRLLDEEARLPRFYAMFAAFGLSTLIAPMMNNAGLYWIAIELTTLISTFLVAFEQEAASIEAAWKYIIVVSAGISLALLGTVLFYWAGTFVIGPTYDMTWKVLQEAAPRLNPALASLAFLLVLIGYGTKVGLAPMHTWLPDAHSEGPAPVSALLSGALLNTAMVGVVRYLAIADAAGISGLARGNVAGARRLLALRRGALHRAPEGRQTPHGLFQRRAHGGHRAGFRIRRFVGDRGGALPHAEPFAEQIGDVLRRRRRDARLRDEAHPGHPARAQAFPRPRRPMAGGGCRDHRSAAVRPVPERARHHPRRAGGVAGMS